MSRKPSVAMAFTNGSRGGERRPEDEAVDEGGAPAERDAGEVRHPFVDADVEQRPRDQRAHGADGPVGEVEHAGGPVEDHEAHAGHGEHPAEGQAEHEERLERLEVRHR